MDENGNGRVREALLVVDDDPLMRWSLRELFGQTHEVWEADSVGAAHRVLEEAERRISVVLLDIGLPDGDGFSVLPHLRAMAPRTPVVVMSANPSPEVRRRAQEEAQAFVSKPVRLSELRELVTRLASSHC